MNDPGAGGPLEPTSAERPRSLRALAALQAFGEPLAALALAFLLTLLASLPLVPLPLRYELPLRPASELEPGDEERLIARVLGDGLAERASIARDEQGARLVLEGVEEPTQSLEAVRDALEDAGFERTSYWAAPQLEVQDLLATDAARSVPRLLAVQAVVFALIGLALMRLRLRREPARAARTGWARAFALGAAGGLAAIASSLVISAVLHVLGFEVAEQEWLERLLAEPGATRRLAPWVVLVVPCAEEIFFRGYLFRFVHERLGLAVALGWSAAVFALIHMNPPGVPIYVAVALVFGWVYHRTGSLAAPIVAHAVLNAFVLFVPVLARPS